MLLMCTTLVIFTGNDIISKMSHSGGECLCVIPTFVYAEPKRRPHTASLVLAVLEKAVFSVTYSPCAAARSQAHVRLSVVDNQYEDTIIQVHLCGRFQAREQASYPHTQCFCLSASVVIYVVLRSAIDCLYDLIVTYRFLPYSPVFFPFLLILLHQYLGRMNRPFCNF